MNTKNNKKYQDTENLICTSFLSLLEEKTFSSISITEICSRAGITRATFYAHCKDTCELMKHTDEMLSADLITALYEYNQNHRIDWKISSNFIRMFEHVKKHRRFYRIYISHVPLFPLFTALPDFYFHISGKKIYEMSALETVDKRKLLFHSSFFYAGMTAFLRIWLESDCKESVEEMLELVYEQYRFQGPDMTPR